MRRQRAVLLTHNKCETSARPLLADGPLYACLVRSMTAHKASQPCGCWHNRSILQDWQVRKNILHHTWEMDSLGVDPAPVSANGDTAALPPAAAPPKELLRAGAGAFQMLPPADAPDVGGPLRIRT